jgi:hypothetical protein
VRWPDKEVKVIVDIAVVVIDRNANTSINCVRKGKSRKRATTVTGAPRRANSDESPLWSIALSGSQANPVFASQQTSGDRA